MGSSLVLIGYSHSVSPMLL